MEIEPISRASAVDVCAAQLREAVLTGSLEVGERLPPERELAQRFEVGRITVRSALGRMVSERLLKSRQGSGYSVLDFTRTAGPAVLGALFEFSGLSRRREIVADLLMVRRHLARGLLERLLEVRPNLDRAAAAVDALAAAVSLDEVVRADIEVVRALCAASESVVLQLALNPVLEVLRAMPALQRAMFRAPQTNVAAYRLVLAWLESGEAEIDEAMAILKTRDDETLLHFGAEP